MNSPAHHSEFFLTRLVFLGLAVLTALLFLYYIGAQNVESHGGVDQNGYLVGGKRLAEYGSMAFSPKDSVTGKADPFQVVGRMWIGADLGTPDERYYPKYPIGLPLLMAAVWRLFGAGAVFWISPVSAALALLGTFLFVRKLAGSVMAWLAEVAVAFSPAMLSLGPNPNSHAATLACVACGMFLLLRWHQSDGNRWFSGMAGGFLLGASVTIRYTEGLLVLPLLVAVATTLRWRSWRSWFDGGAVLAAWALPVGLLVCHNLAAFGHLTGYDPCNESTGFAWDYFRDNWETMLRQLDSNGLFLLFPLGLAGLVALFPHRRDIALILAGWIVPCLLVYTFYYWAPDNMGYMRFFLTVLPALAAAAFWLLSRLPWLTAGGRGAPPGGWDRASAPLAAGLVTGLSLLAGVESMKTPMLNDFLNRDALRTAEQTLTRTMPPGSLLFAQDNSLLHHLQFTTDFVIYNVDAFDRRIIQGFKKVQPDEPQGFQPQRQQFLLERFGEWTQPQFLRAEQGIIKTAIAGGRRVFFVRRLDAPARFRPPTPPAPAGAAPAAAVPAAAPLQPWWVRLPWWRNHPLFPRDLFPPDQFDLTPVGQWCVTSSVSGAPDRVKPRGRKAAFAPAAAANNPQPVQYQLVEVTAKSKLDLQKVLEEISAPAGVPRKKAPRPAAP